MARNYKNYKSYSYLKAGEDYELFELAKEGNDFEPYLLPLNKDQEEKLNNFVEKNLIISLHEHTRVMPKDPFQEPKYTRDSHVHTGFKGLSESRLDCVFENFADGMSIVLSQNGWQWDDIIYNLGMRYCDWDHQDFVVQARRIEDIYNAKKNGQVAIVSVLEGAAFVENDLNRLDILYGFGLRSCGITYEQSNSLGSGKGDRVDSGLTYLGLKAVERMNALGMLIELNHSSYQTAMDTIAHSKQPTTISHTVSQKLRGDGSGKPDDLLKACADKGGVIGIAGCPGAPISIKNPQEGLDAYMEHFEYIKDLVGIEHVTFGPDTLYGHHAGLHAVYAKYFMSSGSSSSNPTFKRNNFVKGLENPTEAMENILRWLVIHNYSEEDMVKLLGLNVINLLKQVWHS